MRLTELKISGNAALPAVFIQKSKYTIRVKWLKSIHKYT